MTRTPWTEADNDELRKILAGCDQTRKIQPQLTKAYEGRRTWTAIKHQLAKLGLSYKPAEKKSLRDLPKGEARFDEAPNGGKLQRGKKAGDEPAPPPAVAWKIHHTGKEWAENVEAYLAERFGTDMVERIASIIANADKEEVRLAAIREVLDRKFGKATSKTEISGPDGGAIKTETDLSHLTTEQLDQLERLLSSPGGSPVNTSEA